MMENDETKRGGLRQELYRREDELMFLRERLLKVEYELEDRLRDLSEEYADRDCIPESEEDLSCVYEREIELLRELLYGEREKPLEKILARRLQAQQRKTMELAGEMGSDGAYSDAYWRHRIEEQLLSDLLRRWWEWLRGPG
jgi:hypothetical protein